MKILELIKKLKDIEKEHGNIDVMITVDWSTILSEIAYKEADAHYDKPHVELT